MAHGSMLPGLCCVLAVCAAATASAEPMRGLDQDGELRGDLPLRADGVVQLGSPTIDVTGGGARLLKLLCSALRLTDITPLQLAETS